VFWGFAFGFASAFTYKLICSKLEIS